LAGASTYRALEAHDQKNRQAGVESYTIPGKAAGQRQRKGDSWKTGAGSTWGVGSFDPKLNLVYWSTSNGGPWGGQTA